MGSISTSTGEFDFNAAGENARRTDGETPELLVTEGFDWIQVRRFPSRVDAEEQAFGGR